MSFTWASFPHSCPIFGLLGKRGEKDERNGVGGRGAHLLYCSKDTQAKCWLSHVPHHVCPDATKMCVNLCSIIPEPPCSSLMWLGDTAKPSHSYVFVIAASLCFLLLLTYLSWSVLVPVSWHWGRVNREIRRNGLLAHSWFDIISI